MGKLTKSPRLNYLLGQMGIFNEYQVVNHLPRRYDNFSYTEERNLKDKQRLVLLGKIISLPKSVVAKGLHIVTFEFMTLNRTYFKVKFFNQPYITKIINLEDSFTLVGSYNSKYNAVDGTSIFKGEIPKRNQIRPVYSLPSDFQNSLFSNLVRRSLESIKGNIHSVIPFTYINKYRLIDKETALNWAHFPETYEQIRQSLRHLKYEEALIFSLKNQIIREQNKSMAKVKKEPIDLSLCKPLIDSLPFKLTEDQETAASEIIEDMNQTALMYRLLQGDVGTGKTLVCFLALYANFIRGDQGALMAPTDSLARQHFDNAKKIFSGTKMKIALLLGSTPIAEKHQIYDDLKEGYIDLVIGTHALFSKSVIYNSLGLAVIDEQHRFGVNQRIMLASKGEHADLLMMSATPIPRSLALTLYGDLDISTLYSFPNKHRSVSTEIIDSNNDKIYEAIDESLSLDKQVYIVAPIIDYREDERYSAEKLYARFVLRYGNKVGLLHGKMKSDEKEDALNKFYSGETPIIVSTQVIEVGIDVKKANLMIIYDASNFGLASLHQLRGRIGRDGSKAKCMLTIDKEEQDAIDKLNILVNSEDGFEIAEQDMKLRGPGELTGTKQAGIPNFAFLNIVDDYKIFVVAREDAKEIIKNKSLQYNSYLIDRIEKDIKNNEFIKG